MVAALFTRSEKLRDSGLNPPPAGLHSLGTRLSNMQLARADMHFCTCELDGRLCTPFGHYWAVSALTRVCLEEVGESMARSHPVDVHVGARMRQRRTLLGMSQEKLGTAVGLTFQQIQKYERGSNRIGSSRLFEFAKVLDVPVSYFFDEMPSNALSAVRCRAAARRAVSEKPDTVRAGEGSADQAGDPRTRPRLLQDSREQGAQAHLRNGEGRRCGQPRGDGGIPQGGQGPRLRVWEFGRDPLDFRRLLAFLANRGPDGRDRRGRIWTTCHRETKAKPDVGGTTALPGVQCTLGGIVGAQGLYLHQ